MQSDIIGAKVRRRNPGAHLAGMLPVVCEKEYIVPHSVELVRCGAPSCGGFLDSPSELSSCLRVVLLFLGGGGVQGL